MSYRSEGPQYANKVWMTLGVKSPQEEQTFYNVSDMLIEPSDILVARSNSSLRFISRKAISYKKQNGHYKIKVNSFFVLEIISHLYR